MPLQIRRGTEAQRQAMTVPLAVGEPLFVTDTGSIWVGDGVSPGGVQVTGLTIEDSVDAVAAALVAGVNQNITFVYGTTQDQANRIDARLDLSSIEGTIDADGFKGPLLADDSGVIVNSANRNITANEISATDISANNLTLTGNLTTSSIVSDFKGSVFGDDSTIIIDALESSINLNQTIKSNVIPAFDDLIDLGSMGSKFASLHLGSEGLYIDGAQIQATFFGGIELPEGSTVNGQPISVLGNFTGDINANIIGDDSSVIVNVATGNIRGNFVGDLRGDVVGSVFGDDSTKIVDAVENKVYALGGFFGPLTDDNGVNSAVVSAGSLRLEVTNQDANIGIRIITNIGVNAGGDIFGINTHHDEDGANELTFLRTRGTNSNQLSINVGDELFSLKFFGRGSDDLGLAADINVLVDPNGIVGSDIVPGKIEFRTTNDAGVTATKLSIDKDGIIDIFDNTTTAGSNPGEVDLATSTVAESWLRVKVGGVEYALPLYAINP